MKTVWGLKSSGDAFTPYALGRVNEGRRGTRAVTAVLVSQSPSISTFEGWLVVISALGFLGMVADKAFARLGVERIPETAFVVCSLAGGLLGIVLGGLVAHHKTSKPQFWVPVVLAAIPSVLLLGYYHGGSV